jgi:hypothetical protein
MRIFFLTLFGALLGSSFTSWFLGKNQDTSIMFSLSLGVACAAWFVGYLRDQEGR